MEFLSNGTFQHVSGLLLIEAPNGMCKNPCHRKFSIFSLIFLCFQCWAAARSHPSGRSDHTKTKVKKQLCSGFLEHQEELAKTVQNLACMHNS